MSGFLKYNISVALLSLACAVTAEAQTLDDFRYKLVYGVPGIDNVINPQPEPQILADTVAMANLPAEDNAQSVSELKELSENEDMGDLLSVDEFGEVSINESDEARWSLLALEQQPKVTSKNAYRIDIFFSNRADARSEAQSYLRRADSLYVEFSHSMSYQNPYFKVSTGPFVSQDEAIMALHKLSRHFPKAFLVRDKITTEDMLEQQRRESAMDYARELIQRDEPSGE